MSSYSFFTLYFELDQLFSLSNPHDHTSPLLRGSKTQSKTPAGALSVPQHFYLPCFADCNYIVREQDSKIKEEHN